MDTAKPVRGLHRFFGLATQPPTELRQRVAFPVLSTTPILSQGTSSSASRSQVRGWAEQQRQDNSYLPTGTRVGRVSLGRPGAPAGANDKEFMVSPFHGGISKRTLGKAICIANQTGASKYRGRTMPRHGAWDGRLGPRPGPSFHGCYKGVPPSEDFMGPRKAA